MRKKSSGDLLTLITIAVLLVLPGFMSCEKEVDIKLDKGESKIVVEGAIETGYPPYVFLTKSIGYFASIDLNTLQNTFIHGADVRVSDGTKTIKLREYAVDTGNGSKLSFYTIDTADLSSLLFKGEEGKFYKLTIDYEGKHYEATTKVPHPTPLDSVLSVLPAPPFNRTKFPNARQIRIVFKDPDTLGNHIRYYTKRNSEPFYPGLNSVYSDELINGTVFATVISMGEPRSLKFNDSLGVCDAGDTVVFKWCSIDKVTFDFWSTYEYSINTLGNPFSTPVNLKSNISNNAVGIWAGYGSRYFTLKVE
jgi:hypothetical protein